ncbi:RNA polymerase sigma-70 factor [Pedobacter sp. BS3]|uniref:RNA polymerase sigma factor n=1 Tax=Pedobacter sp. BS3 TaxID=2567937 RepID=UPI0011EE19D0|nr:RNA polymerase sigma-70 factor [Pedobacter sp. BS3]TZF81350.1 RNA polymerase sigma-70 factor [Pedobacter sp. BS3]
MALYSEYTDQELVTLLTADDEKAFRTLYNRYWQRLLLKAYMQLGTYTEAEEVVQDTFINLWKRRHRIQLHYSFHTYIAAVVRYEIMAKLAGRKVCEHIPVDDARVLSLADHSTQQWLDFEELSKQIELEVQQLPEKCQLVFRLSREKGLTEKQVAENLDISVKTVEAHISKALKTLRVGLSHILLFVIIIGALPGIGC